MENINRLIAGVFFVVMLNLVSLILILASPVKVLSYQVRKSAIWLEANPLKIENITDTENSSVIPFSVNPGLAFASANLSLGEFNVDGPSNSGSSNLSDIEPSPLIKNQQLLLILLLMVSENN